MKYELELLMPNMPNFLRLGGFPPRRREDGIDKDPPSIDVGQLTPEQVEEFIANWSEKFREHASERRATCEVESLKRSL